MSINNNNITDIDDSTLLANTPMMVIEQDGKTIAVPMICPAVPTGAYISWAGATPPAGYLPCNGAAVSRTTYKALFAVIGTLYGAGDGNTTFNLPDCSGKFLQGASTVVPVGTYVAAGLPEISGSIIMRYGTTDVMTGSFTKSTGEDLSSTSYPSQQPAQLVSFAASRSSKIYGKSTTVQPPALATLICIKY